MEKTVQSKQNKSRRAVQAGGYSILVTAIVLAILVVLNILASALPATLTKLDISSSKLYSVTSNTKAVVHALTKDVTIYWIVQADEEDEIIENLLAKYDSLSDHIEVIKKNPDVFPTFAAQYTTATVQNNSLVVECGDRFRFIGYDDIYVTEADMYSYSYTTSFDGEGAITSAIDYVVSEDLPQLYLLTGHGEVELPSGFAEQIEKENMETQSFSLLNVDAVPDDADCVVIYNPASDISEEEADMLVSYAEAGGKLLVMAGPTEDGTLTNLSAVLSSYGVETVEGIVIEGDRQYYAFQVPYILMPELNSHAVTDSLISERYYPILPLAQGLQITGYDDVTSLLDSSDASFSKIAGYALNTYEKEEGDADGPFSLAVSIETDAGGQIIWFSSALFLEDMYNAYSSGANLDLAMNALSELIGESEAMAIRAKSLNYNYLTINEASSALLKAVMIGVFPLIYLGIGVCVVVRRRRLQNETIQ